jgi:hypothetical protein
MTDQTERPDAPAPQDGLEDFFGAARRMRPDPSEALMARVLEDALAAQAAPAAAAQAAPVAAARVWRRARPGVLAQLREALGGWPAIGGLATAGVMGLAVGISAAAGLGDLTAALLGQPGDAYLVDLMPELDFDIAMDLSEG